MSCLGAAKAYMKRLLAIGAMVLCTYIAGVSSAWADENVQFEEKSTQGRSVGEFLTPEGQFDIEEARRTRYERSLDIEGFQSVIDPQTGQPFFQPSPSAMPTDDPDDIYWDNNISPCIAGVGDVVTAATVYEGNLVVGGSFQAADCVIAYYVASWDGSSWSPLGSGMNNTVEALIVHDGKLIAGGGFTIAGGVSAGKIAAWDGSSWSSVGTGMGTYGHVASLSVYDSKLIAGGNFTTAGGVPASCIAAWDGTSWSPLGSGMGGTYAEVNALTVFDSRLIAAGIFTAAGGVTAGGIAAWDGSTWLSLGSGLGGSTSHCRALTIYSNRLIVGGEFTSAGGISANGIAAWDGISWSALQSGMGGTSPFVYSLAIYDSKLIAGGPFRIAGSVNGEYIAAWNGTSWSPLGPGLGNTVEALTIYDGKLIAGGEFVHAGGTVANYVASWNGSSWSPIGSGMFQGVDQGVGPLAIYNGKLVAGGGFTATSGVKLFEIASWDGGSWSPLSTVTGISSASADALTVYDGKLIAGGYFTAAGGVAVNNIASWDGSSWSPLGSGMGGEDPDYVNCLTVFDGKLIAGGYFTAAGGVAVNHIASWDGSSWSPLGSGMNYHVLALTEYDGKLVAGGHFTTAGGVAVNHIASWDGSSWSPLGSGMTGDPFVLTVYNGRLIAGGWFTTAGGVAANKIASWDGSSWSPLGSGMNRDVRALTVYDGKLIAGGYFTTAGGAAANYIASWDGSSWSPLGSGMGGRALWPYVYDLTVYNGELITGGGFTTAGGKVSAYIAKWTKRESPQSTLSVASSPASGVSISVSPENCPGGTTTPFSCSYADGTDVTLTAPVTAGEYVFEKWTKDGEDWGFSTTSPTLTMDADHTVEALYIPVHTLSVMSSPTSGLSITMSPDNCPGGTTTPFSCDYSEGSGVILTAPATAGANVFLKWQKDGNDWGSNTTSPILTMDADYTVMAVYMVPAPRALNVSSNPETEVSIVVSPSNCPSGTITPFSCTYANGTDVTLTAPPMADDDLVFQEWHKDGAVWGFSLTSPTLTMDADYSVTAVYRWEGLCLNVEGNYAVRNAPRSICAADLDGDGDEDLVVANQYGGSISILKNYGNGAFAPRNDYAAGPNISYWPISVTAADFDGDGDKDLAITLFFEDIITPTHRISILKNNGDGTFASPLYYAIGNPYPWAIVAADLDGDGDQDLAWTKGNSHISVMKNIGNGTFSEVSDFAGGSGISSIIAADLDGDGDKDLVMTGAVLLNDGTGCFPSAVNYTAGPSPSSVFAADLDRDGDQDLAVTNNGSNTVSILKNNGDGTYSSAVSYVTGDISPQSVVAADLDGDGDKDLAITNSAVVYPHSMLSILLNNGSGVFSSAITFGVGDSPWSLIAADLDGDGDQDLAVTNSESDDVSVLINCGDPLSYITSVTPVPSALNVPRSIQITATFSKDMNPATINANTFVVIGNTSGPVQGIVTYNNSTRTATFTPSSPLPVAETIRAILTTDIKSSSGLPLNRYGFSWSFTTAAVATTGHFGIAMEVPSGTAYTDLAVADFNGDGYPDIAQMGSTSNVSVILNNGTGTDATTGFGQYLLYPVTAGQFGVSVAANDIDGDSDVDIAVLRSTDYSNYVSILRNNGNGIFSVQSAFSVGNGRGGALCTGDFNLDGRADLAVALQNHVTYPTNYYVGYFAVMFGNGNGTFSVSASYSRGWTEISGLWTADLDGDGFSDVMAGNGDGTSIAIFRNDGHGSFVFSSNLGTPGLQSVTDVEIADLNGDSRVDIVTIQPGIANPWHPWPRDGRLTVFEGLGSGQFALETSYSLDPEASSAAIGDIDGDGDLDLLMSVGSPNYVDGDIFVRRNFGSFDFRDLGGGRRCSNPCKLALADLDNDGDLDMIVGGGYGSDYSPLVLKSRDCYDSDGDTYGDPGHPENVCQTDNCPTVYNPDQNPAACTFAASVPTGNTVEIDLGSSVTVTFESVTEGGNASMAISTLGPEGYDYAVVPFAAPAYYDVAADATTAGQIQVCVFYDDAELNVETEERLRLIHHNGTEWEDITSSGYPDQDNNVICGVVTSFSPFAVGVSLSVSCCVDRVGDANNSAADEPTIGDVSTMIDALFISGDPAVITCLEEADINQSGGPNPVIDDITIGDISILIDYLFIKGPYDPATNPEGVQLPECL